MQLSNIKWCFQLKKLIQAKIVLIGFQLNTLVHKSNIASESDLADVLSIFLSGRMIYAAADKN